jgi:hypothetical protein
VNYQTLIMFMCLAVGVMAWYANTSKRNVILCTFHRVNKTIVKKFVKMQGRALIFENRKYDIVPSRISFLWYNAGLIHMLFPQWVAALDFDEGKRWPWDSNKMNYDIDNPEIRKVINTSDLMKSYFNTANPATANKKISGLMQYLPWVAIGLVVVVYFLLDNKMKGFGTQLDAVVNALNAITK